ncbi:MAG: Hsp20/alpha crystallin family protein [Thiomonas sp.]
MAIVQWNPLSDIDDVFNRYTRALGWPRNAGKSAADVEFTVWSPRVDISEAPQAFTIKAEIPGVNKDEVKVNVDNGVLTISGERKQEKEEKDKTFHRIERHYGSFSRSFSLPDNADGAATKATFKDGMLNLEIPKKDGAAPKVIEIAVQ